MVSWSQDNNYLRANSVKHVWHPMGHPNDVDAHPPRVFVKGEGVYVTDGDGNRVLDAVGGLWNVNLGYSNAAVKEAIARQLDELPYYSSFKGNTNPRLIELSHRLAEILQPEDMVRAFFTSGGSDSVESALRIARQYWKASGRAERFKFISLRRGYHGTHFGGASVNGNPNFRRAYEPMLPGCSQVPAPFTYRNPFDESDPERLADLCLAALEDEIRFQGPDTVAAFIAEPVLGAGGVIVPPASYWPGLRTLLDKYEILLIADEVVSGFGRTGSWFGARGWSVKPDLMCFAKGITSGYIPFGAVMVNRRLERAFQANNDALGVIFHGYTYSGHPVGCAAALAALDETFSQDLTTNAGKEGAFLLDGFRRLQSRFPTIGEVRGKGLMLGLEMVADRATKALPGPKYLGAIADIAYAAGVNVRTQLNVMIFSPPLILQRHESEQILAGLETAFARNQFAPSE